MEKTDRAAVIAGDFRWSDIGSWDALFDITRPTPQGNVLQGQVVTIGHDRLRRAFRRPSDHSGRRQGSGRRQQPRTR